MKFYTRIVKNNEKKIFRGFKSINFLYHFFLDNEKIEIEYFARHKKTRFTVALYFYRGHALIGQVYPNGYCRNSSLLS